MRIPYLSAVILLVVLAGSATLAWAATATFTPPAETGNIFTIIDFPRAQGRAQAVVVSVTVGDSVRNRSFVPNYRSCTTTTPAGIVLKMRHPRPDTVPVTVVTTGKIIRGPYLGDPPLELLHPCYKLVS